MKYFLLFTLCIASLGANSQSSSFWKHITSDDLEKVRNKNVIIEGSITHIKRKYNARDTYYYIDIKDDNSDRYVEIKLYTIKWLKKMNHFACEVGDKMRVSGVFNHKVSGDKIGSVEIKGPDKKLRCFTPKIKTKDT